MFGNKLRLLFGNAPAQQVLRFATVVALAVWFGGFTFYSTAVISTSQRVLHSQLRAGLITQQVTNWLNGISVPVLAICAWNWLVCRKSVRSFWVTMLGLALFAMICLQSLLFPAHWLLDWRIVDRQVADEGGFFKLHRVYLVVSTAQWCATLGYIWSALILWSGQDADNGLVAQSSRSNAGSSHPAPVCDLDGR